MTTPIPDLPNGVTSAVRDAVYADDCKQNGHILSLENCLSISDEDTKNGRHAVDVQGPDNETFAHLRCRRCGRCWIVIEESGGDYDQAVGIFTGLLKNPNVKPKRKDKKRDPHESLPLDLPLPTAAGKKGNANG